MYIKDDVLQEDEKIIFALRELYAGYGYAPYRMSKFEEYDLYAGNKDFLVSDHVITFTDTNGKLLALKPDVTLSIIKNSTDDPSQVQKVFYNENVYRVSKGSGAFQEIMQTGLECFGKIDQTALCEVVELAAKSLLTLSSSVVLNLSNLDFIETILDAASFSEDGKKKAFRAMTEKNPDALLSLCKAEQTKEAYTAILQKLLSVNGALSESLPQCKEICVLLEEEIRSSKHVQADKCEAAIAVINGFLAVLQELQKSEVSSLLSLDFSITADFNYYNGIVFNGFLQGAPTVVLSGGQYDRSMQKLGRKSAAVGFAVYLDAVFRKQEIEAEENAAQKTVLNIALPKGRLGETVYAMLEKAGYACPSMNSQNRKLIFEDEQGLVRYFWVKPSDVAIYVERGAADIGICGKDIIEEYAPEIYEILDLHIGKCRMAVAGPASFTDNTEKPLRVATKFSAVARSYYQRKGREIDIIHLNGSIEIAPILGLSDVIVDIVETGTTLRENNLSVLEEIMPISARLICNRSAYQFKGEAVRQLTANLSVLTEKAEA